MKELRSCVTHLIKISSLIRKSAPTDPFDKAVSRDRYRFNDQFDVAHVGQKYPKLAADSAKWLRRRLGQAITKRRSYLSYMQDHQDKLRTMLNHEDDEEKVTIDRNRWVKKLAPTNRGSEMASQPATLQTKASTFVPGHIDVQLLRTKQYSSSGSEAKTYSTISHSHDVNLDDSAKIKIPRLEDLRNGSKEIECPFCFRIKKIRNDRAWHRHVFFDLRAYVCTFPDCSAPLFNDVDEWFRHEMQNHRTRYKCHFCEDNKSFDRPEKYLQHIQKVHADTIDDLGDESIFINVARQPLSHIPAQDCPCCDEWAQQLESHVGADGEGHHENSKQVILVEPHKFKRHLAAHLEQLTLFAVPAIRHGEEEVGSDLANEDGTHKSASLSALSKLTFDSQMQQESTGEGSEQGSEAHNLAYDETMENTNRQTGFFDDAVVKATDESLTSVRMEHIMDICNMVTNSEAAAKEVLSAVFERLRHTQSFVILHTIELLRALMQNCGPVLHKELASGIDLIGLVEVALDHGHDQVFINELLVPMGQWLEQLEAQPQPSMDLFTIHSLRDQITDIMSRLHRDEDEGQIQTTPERAAHAVITTDSDLPLGTAQDRQEQEADAALYPDFVPEDDRIVFLQDGAKWPMHFAANSIRDGQLKIGNVRKRLAETLRIDDARRISMAIDDNVLENDDVTVWEAGWRGAFADDVIQIKISEVLGEQIPDTSSHSRPVHHILTKDLQGPEASNNTAEEEKESYADGIPYPKFLRLSRKGESWSSNDHNEVAIY